MPLQISVVLVPHNGAYHIIPVPSPKRDPNAPSSSRERRRVTSHSSKLMYAGAGPSGDSSSTSSEGMAGRRSEENKATKNKMAALQKQLKEKRAAPAGASQASCTLMCCSSLGSSNHSTTPAQIAPALISRHGGQCCASNLQKTILSEYVSLIRLLYSHLNPSAILSAKSSASVYMCSCKQNRLYVVSIGEAPPNSIRRNQVIGSY